ncbi:hypothetical protein B566_EDAN005162 [Ephemera danica]|nr:hypothetical protein B566_EDAN005162 [Ephemera danica]
MIKGQVVISKIILDISTAKENGSQENYVSSDDGQELEKFKIENWKLFLAGKLEANNTFTDQTDNLTITYRFEVCDFEACKKLLGLDGADNAKVIHDHVFNITYTRKLVKQTNKSEKCPVTDELNVVENKIKKKPLQPRNKCNTMMNPGQTDAGEKVSQRKRGVEEKTEFPATETLSSTEVPESKKVKASKSDSKTKKSSTLSLKSHKHQPTLHKFFATSPPGVKTETKMEEKLMAITVPDAEEQPPKPEKEVVLCYPVNTPKKEEISAIANLQNIAKKISSPVKSSKMYPSYDPMEDVGLDEFAMTDPEIAKRMFQRNLPFLQAIQAGNIFSIRHQEYHSDIQKRRTMDYAPGCINLGDKNLGLFMELMGDVLTTSNDDHRDKIPYFMLVLVPELITKIVMGVFNISKQEAVKKKKDIGILVTKNTPYLF